MTFTPEEIVTMAKEAGFGMQMAMLDHPYCQADAQRLYQQLERFAALVAEKAAAEEREAIRAALIQEYREWGELYEDSIEDVIRSRGQKE